MQPEKVLKTNYCLVVNHVISVTSIRNMHRSVCPGQSNARMDKLKYYCGYLHGQPYNFKYNFTVGFYY